MNVKILSTAIAGCLILTTTGCGTAVKTASTSSTTPAVTADAQNKQNDAKQEQKAKDEQAAKAKSQEEAEAKKKAEQESKTASQMKTLTPSLTSGGSMDDKTFAFIVKNNKLFPAKTDSDVQDATSKVDSSVTIRHLNKNVAPYFDKLVEFSGEVVQVQEQNDPNMGTISVVHIADDNDNSIVGLYMNSTGDLLEGDNATIIGVPVTDYSFQNVGGGTTNAILLAASVVKKTK